MIEFICLFLPPFLAVNMLNMFEKENYDFKYFLKNYPICLLFVNFLNFIVLWILNGKIAITESFGTIYAAFVVKYLLMGIIFSILTSIVIYIFRKNIKFDITFKKGKNKNE